MMYVVYTEVIDNGVERWFYGLYDSRNRANEVALMLGHDGRTYHCVCKADEAREMNILNLPH